MIWSRQISRVSFRCPKTSLGKRHHYICAWMVLLWVLTPDIAQVEILLIPCSLILSVNTVDLNLSSFRPRSNWGSNIYRVSFFEVFLLLKLKFEQTSF
jgi:hypothetical protein